MLISKWAFQLEIKSNDNPTHKEGYKEADSSH